ncbi:hypothetical protein G5B40_10315 [Pikeienuella piscinae]|uniref:DUF5666 domain-containing protein n=1 Tax=Pikeienuella piscinae TaxID=2748098 RepID=A0A7L5BU94_9RHOB|nr:DUF6152 family protein [Pikeienuella piscinae]QIE55810.1 hypothetical protein G5B40_10315 [Pikeienuella piscinae]
MYFHRRGFLGLLGAAALIRPAVAHHGYMAWDTENPIVLEGWISKEMDGFPHWEFWMRVDGEDWEVDIGDQYTLERAGFSSSGKEFKMRDNVIVEGVRPVDRSIRRILPSRITLEDGVPHDITVKG